MLGAPHLHRGLRWGWVHDHIFWAVEVCLRGLIALRELETAVLSTLFHAWLSAQNQGLYEAPRKTTWAGAQGYTSTGINPQGSRANLLGG